MTFLKKRAPKEPEQQSAGIFTLSKTPSFNIICLQINKLLGHFNISPVQFTKLVQLYRLLFSNKCVYKVGSNSKISSVSAYTSL